MTRDALLFPDPLRERPRRPRRPRRVRMLITDAGDGGYSVWTCPRCERILVAWVHADDEERLRHPYAEPCPWCGPTWGRLRASREQRLELTTPDGRHVWEHAPVYGPRRPGSEGP